MKKIEKLGLFLILINENKALKLETKQIGYYGTIGYIFMSLNSISPEVMLQLYLPHLDHVVQFPTL